ncbi:hypothetical protein WMY93_001000, partial [Mugilogobius chulae]
MALTLLILMLCSLGSYSVRLVGGASRCQGEAELQRAGLNWTSVDPLGLTLGFGATLCSELDCGSALSVETKGTSHSTETSVLKRECGPSSVRLVSGSGSCSGSVQIWDQSWTWLCEGALDLLGAEVLCRELGCGAPSVLQGRSLLWDCRRFTLRLVGRRSRCAGAVEMTYRKHWRRVMNLGFWTVEHTDAVCRQLKCALPFLESYKQFPQSPVWRIYSDCVKNSAVRDCVLSKDSLSTFGLNIVCSAPLSWPELHPAAVNHSAHFWFSDTGPAHKGNYVCVFHQRVLNHNFSSQASPSSSIWEFFCFAAADSDFIIRFVVILLLKLMYILPLYFTTA